MVKLLLAMEKLWRNYGEIIATLSDIETLIKIVEEIIGQVAI